MLGAGIGAELIPRRAPRRNLYLAGHRYQGRAHTSQGTRAELVSRRALVRGRRLYLAGRWYRSGTHTSTGAKAELVPRWAPVPGQSSYLAGRQGGTCISSGAGAGANLVPRRAPVPGRNSYLAERRCLGETCTSPGAGAGAELVTPSTIFSAAHRTSTGDFSTRAVLRAATASGSPRARHVRTAAVHNEHAPPIWEWTARVNRRNSPPATGAWESIA